MRHTYRITLKLLIITTMKKIIIPSLFALLALETYAQNSRYSSGFGIDGRNIYSMKKEANAEVIDGSPYLVEKLMPATIEGFEGTQLLRYNEVKDEMEYQSPEGEMYIVAKRDVDRITFKNAPLRTFVRTTYYNNEKSEKNGYLLVVKELEKSAIYKKELIKYVPKKTADNSYSQSVNAHYRRGNDEFYIKNGENIYFVPRKSKDFIALFPGMEAKIGEYIKKNKIDLKDQSDLIELTTFINTL